MWKEYQMKNYQKRKLLKTDYKAVCQVHNFVNKSMHMFTWKNIRKTFPKKPSIYLV